MWNINGIKIDMIAEYTVPIYSLNACELFISFLSFQSRGIVFYRIVTPILVRNVVHNEINEHIKTERD